MEDALKELFKRHFGLPAESSLPLRADASPRRLFRLSGGGKTAIGVLNADKKENRAFLSFSRHFRKAGLAVPAIYEAAKDGVAYLEEDLGDTTLFQLLSAKRTPHGFPEEVKKIYREAVTQLPRFQIVAGKTLDYSLCYPRAAFDRRSMLWDMSYFKYYFLQLARVPFDEQALQDDFERFADLLETAPASYFLYRDFQSRNIMVRDGRPWFIDYAGGRKGALQYDIASILLDAKADVPFDLRDEILSLYLDETCRHAKVDRKKFLKLFPAFAFIRVMQAMGAYGLRGFHEQKPLFLQSIPYAIRNIERLLGSADFLAKLPELSKVFKRLVASSYLRQMGSASLTLTVRVSSFSYMGGMPTDDKGHGGGFVFDCRALPNPGRQARFAQLTGKDGPVVEWLAKEPAVQKFLEGVYSLVDQTVENYKSRNFTDLSVAFGCTGGRHRSVYCAERLAEHLRSCGVHVEVHHREREKDERPEHGP